MNILSLLDRIRHTTSCELCEPSGLPDLPEGIRIPDDLSEFYTLCGGARLFVGKDYEISICSPEQFVRANPVIVGDLCKEDISFHWFIVARGGDQLITIDLYPERLGRCYDSFWDRHGVVGECAIVARSFEELLRSLLENNGDYWYWLRSDFEPLGDAYD